VSVIIKTSAVSAARPTADYFRGPFPLLYPFADEWTEKPSGISTPRVQYTVIVVRPRFCQWFCHAGHFLRACDEFLFTSCATSSGWF